MKYSSDGTTPITIVDGSKPTGLFAADGSTNAVLASGLVPCGLYHPTGALNVTVSTGTVSGIYAPDGSLYVSFNGTNYYIDLLGGAQGGGGNLPAPPTGFVYLTGADGAFLQGADGAYLLGAA